MKRVVSIGVIVLVVIICCCVSCSSFIFYTKSLCNYYDVISNSDDSFVVKMYDVDLCDIVDAYNVEVSNVFEFNDRVVIEGYTNMFPKYVVKNYLKTNIQISCFDGVCLVGYPLIDVSF